MNEDLLKAATALSLSPRKPRAPSIVHHKQHPPCSIPPNKRIAPLGLSLHQISVSAPARPPIDVATSLDTKATYCRSKASLRHPNIMPRGSKRLREATAVDEDMPSPLKHAKRSSTHDSNTQDVIVISSDDEPSEPIDSSPEGPSLASLAGLYTYESPTKARQSRKASSNTATIEASQMPLALLQASTASSSLSISLDSIVKGESSASTPLPSTRPPTTKAKKAKAPKKTAQRSTIQLKKTVQEAEQAGISPHDVSAIPSAGFRLLPRCSFCAGSFTKSASAKVKQDHMSLCAPLSGIAKSETAVKTIHSDVRSALRRDEDAKRKAEAERTVFQQTVQEADLVLHEGRASQIEASPKKRGKDSVIVKKAIKRTTKPALLLAEPDSDGARVAPPSAATHLLPARKAMLVARDVANQLFGNVLPSSARSDDKYFKPTDESAPAPDEASSIPSTPKKLSRHTPTKDDKLPPIDGEVDETNHLPIVSAEQVFASLSATSPQKSPFKALQKSRQRQASKDGELLSGALESQSGQSSPSMPRTQPFAPSKLAQRQRAMEDKQRQSLFGAQTTTRSLSDLISDHRKEVESNPFVESKRKASETDEGVHSPQSKRYRVSQSPCEDSTDRDTVDLRSLRDSLPRDTEEELTSPSCSEMDLDEMMIDEALPSQPALIDSPIQDKLQAQDFGTARIKPPKQDAAAEDIDQQASHSLEQHSPADLSDEGVRPISKYDDAPAILDSDGIIDDDDDDAQSFLDMLEPTEVIYEPILAQHYTSSVRSSEEPGVQDSDEAAYRQRRMVMASGDSPASESRTRRGTLLPSSSPQLVKQPSRSDAEARESSVATSDPEAMLLSAYISDNSP